MKKIISLIIVLSLLFVLLISSCSKSPDSKTEDASAISGSEVDEGTTQEDYFADRKSIKDTIPDGIDFKGEEVKILHFKSYEKFVLSEEYTGEIVNDTMYSANLAVGDRFNTKITFLDLGLDEPGIVKYMEKCSKSGDDSFNFGFGHDLLTPALSLQGYFENLYDLKYLNFEKPWWNKKALEEYTVLDQCYLGITSMSYMGLARSRLLLINEDKFRDLGLELPYNDVINGTWTLDKLIDLTRNIYNDINGNQQKDDGDFYGYISEGACYGYLENFGINIMGRDDEGFINVGFDIGKMSDLTDKLYNWLCKSEGAHLSSDANAFPSKPFANGEVLIARAQIDEALDDIRNSKISYGLVPMPKYDMNQPEYITSCGEFVMVVPTTMSEDKLDRTSAVIEAMSAEGYKNIFPAYFEVALQTKYFDNQSVQMLNIVNESRRSSFSFVYDNGVGMVHAIYNMMCLGATANPSSNFVSYYEKREPLLLKQIDNLNKSFTKLSDNN